MEKIFSFAWKGKRGMTDDAKQGEGKPEDTYVNDEQGLQRRHNVDTFLQVGLFFSF
jgi:calcium uptake protein 3, mitochondrial